MKVYARIVTLADNGAHSEELGDIEGAVEAVGPELARRLAKWMQKADKDPERGDAPATIEITINEV